MEDNQEKKYAPALFEDEIKECEAAMSLDELEINTHPVNAPVVFQDQVGEVNEAAMSDRVLCPAQLFHRAFSITNPSSGDRRVSNDVMGRKSPKQAHKANPPPYFQKLVGILGLGSGSSVSAAFNNFDKQALMAIHNKGLSHFTQVATGEYFCMHHSVEEESQCVQNEYEHLESAQELVPVYLRDLIIGKRNECAVLYGELCVIPFKFGKIHTVMKEAVTEDAVALSIVSSDPLSINQTFARKTYPKGMKIVVKEPHLVKSKNGFIFIDVDNPLSIETVESFPSPSDVNDTSINAKFKQWFGDGDHAYKEKEWNDCVRNYTRCQLCCLYRNTGHEQMYLKRAFKLLSERCRAYIELQRYTEAFQDAEKCWQLEPSNIISNVLKVESLVTLGRYKAAYNFIESCSKSMKRHNRAIFRQTCMKYHDIGESIAGIRREIGVSSQPDADFIGAVEIKMTKNGCGRGMFATESIKAGEVLLISKALAVSDKYYSSFMFDPTQNGLLQNVRNALSKKGDRALQLFFSFDIENFHSRIPNMSEFIEEECAVGKCYTLETTSQNSKADFQKENVRNIFKNISGAQILNIINRIAFDERSPAVIEESARLSNAVNDYNKERSFFGVWLLPSFINHSCVPNASRINIGGGIIMRVHATKDINRGEEITIPYFDVLVPCSFRMIYNAVWGFDCLCPRCDFERYIESTNPEVRLCLKRYISAYDMAAMSRINWGRPLMPCSITSGARPCINLESMSILTYDVELFKKCIPVDDQERRWWIISGFSGCYLALLVEMAVRDSLHEDPGKYDHAKGLAYRGIVRDLIEAIAGTCPGDPRYLLLCQKIAQSWRKHAVAAKIAEDLEMYSVCSCTIERIEEDTKKACICVYGQQKQHVVEAILSKYSKQGIL